VRGASTSSTGAPTPACGTLRATALARLVLEPWLAGRLGLVNAFGTGVADDKLAHAHVDAMVRF
jgi:hypothetical protein